MCLECLSVGTRQSYAALRHKSSHEPEYPPIATRMAKTRAFWLKIGVLLFCRQRDLRSRSNKAARGIPGQMRDTAV